jgi:Domain of unknown function (DUF2382)/PRC-barrel domain
MNTDYDGSTVFDGADEKVGTVERTYIDDSDTVRFVAVRTGTLFHKHRLIPADTAELREDGLHVPYAKEDIDDGPTIDNPEDTLEGDILSQTREYYGDTPEDGNVAKGDTALQANGNADTTPADTTARNVVDMADIPRVPAADGATMESLSQVRDLGDVIEVPVVEERIVRQPVVREVVRVKKSHFTDASTVAGEVRKESVDVDSDGGVLAGGDTGANGS